MKKIYAIFYFILFSQTSILSQNLDIDLLKNIARKEPNNWDKPMQTVTNSVHFVGIGSPLLLLSTGLLKKDKVLINNGLENSASLILSYGSGYLLKKAIDRKRPYEKYPFIKNYQVENDASFPSGSTTIAFTTATTLSINYPKWYVIVPSYGYATAVAYSRMHLGVHYPTDVLAGALLGTTSAFITHKANKWLQKKENKRIIRK